MSETTTGAALVAEGLAQYGVEYVFGNPGTTELPVLRAIGRRDIDYVQALHEDVAVGMASGYAARRRYDDERPLGVANLHVTPGLLHGLANVYGATYAGAPVLITAGNHERDFRTAEPILTGDLVEAVDQFVTWSDEALHVDAVPRLLRRAVREALTPPQGPVFLALPLDVMRAETTASVEPLGALPDAGTGDPAQLDRAADLLAEAASPALVLGDEVARADGGLEAAIALAEASGARVHEEILACEANFPRDHPQWISPIPPEADRARLLLSTDTLILVGTSTNTTILRHDEPLVDPETTTIHIGTDPHEVGKTYPTDAAILGDPAGAMAALADRLQDAISPQDRQRRIDQVEATAEALVPTIEAMGVDEAPDDPRPSKADLVDALAAVAPDAFVVDEGVTAKYALLTRWAFEGRDFISSKSGGLGYGLPAAVGVALADESQRPVVAHVGDGSYLYYPQTVYSAVRLGLDLTVVVPNNRGYHILERNSETLFGAGGADAVPGLDVDPGVSIAGSAEQYGATGHSVRESAALEPTLASAVANEGVDVVDVAVHD